MLFGFKDKKKNFHPIRKKPHPIIHTSDINKTNVDVRPIKFEPYGHAPYHPNQIAISLEQLDNKIWDKLGIEAGSDFDNNPELWKKYVQTIKNAKISDKLLDHNVYAELEDDNYHSLSKALVEITKRNGFRKKELIKDPNA